MQVYNESSSEFRKLDTEYTRNISIILPLLYKKGGKESTKALDSDMIIKFFNEGKKIKEWTVRILREKFLETKGFMVLVDNEKKAHVLIGDDEKFQMWLHKAEEGESSTEWWKRSISIFSLLN
jgi:hypothetical protein